MSKEKMESPKPITFEYEGKKYTLTYTRQSIKLAERLGFDINELASKPMTMVPLLFHGAFLVNHRGVTQDRTEEILYALPSRNQLISRLVELYNYPLSVLIGEDENEGDEKNGVWE